MGCFKDRNEVIVGSDEQDVSETLRNMEFALPFRGHGEHILEFEPREEERGAGFRIRFST